MMLVFAKMFSQEEDVQVLPANLEHIKCGCAQHYETKGGGLHDGPPSIHQKHQQQLTEKLQEDPIGEITLYRIGKITSHPCVGTVQCCTTRTVNTNYIVLHTT